MANPTPFEKGNALEEAVRAIETAIIRSFPGYSESAFRIEGKKYVTVNDVRHEIDIYVTASLGPGYGATFIFECKNWQEKVGKNEIIVFSEKVKASNAQRGFFVAKSFTADAVAQAKQDSRLELLVASELDSSAVIVPAGFHSIQLGKTDGHVLMRGFNSNDRGAAKPVDIATATCVLNGDSIDLGRYINEWLDQARHERCNYFPSGLVDPGEHVLEFNAARAFDIGRAVVNGNSVRAMELSGRVHVQVTRAVVVSAFEVESRGRVVTVQIDGPIGQIKAEFVQLSEPSPTA